MRFERYDGYWGHEPHAAKRLRFQVIPEAAARLAALRAGQVALVEAVPPLDAGVLARDATPQGRLEPAEARLPALPERPPEGQVRLRRQGRPLHRPARAPGAQPRRQPGRDRQEDLPRLRAAERLAGRHGVVRLRGAGALPLRSRSARRRCSPRRAGRTRTARALDKGGETLALQLLLPGQALRPGLRRDDAGGGRDAEGRRRPGRPSSRSTSARCSRRCTKGTLPCNGGFTACRTSNNLDADDYVRDWASHHADQLGAVPAGAAGLYKATRREVDPRSGCALLADLQKQVRDWAPVVPLYQEVKIYAHSARVLSSCRSPSCTWTSAASRCGSERTRCARSSSGASLHAVFVVWGVVTVVFFLVRLTGDPAAFLVDQSRHPGGDRAHARHCSASTGRCSSSTLDFLRRGPPRRLRHLDPRAPPGHAHGARALLAGHRGAGRRRARALDRARHPARRRLGHAAQDRLADHASRIASLFLQSMPSFWLGLMLILLFAVELGGLLPAYGSGTPAPPDPARDRARRRPPRPERAARSAPGMLEVLAAGLRAHGARQGRGRAPRHLPPCAPERGAARSSPSPGSRSASC